MNLIWTLTFALIASIAACSSAQPQPQDAPEVEESPARGALAASDFEETPEGFQEVEVLQTLATGDGYVVLLQDKAAEYITPIFVGEGSAMAIQLRLERRRYQRPLTHDLLDDMLQRLDARVVKVHIDGLKTGVFVGRIFVVREDEILEFDARSSDAIALAVGNEVPIFIADAVVEEAGILRREMEKQLRPGRGEDSTTTTEPL